MVDSEGVTEWYQRGMRTPALICLASDRLSPLARPSPAPSPRPPPATTATAPLSASFRELCLAGSPAAAAAASSVEPARRAPAATAPAALLWPTLLRQAPTRLPRLDPA